MTDVQKLGKRSRLIQASLALVYRHGFKMTRLADIAAEANVPPGNVYYYFKTKEEIGAAIVEEHLVQIQALHQKLDEIDSPQERLCAFVRMTLDNRKMLARGGCPTGTLCTELHKEGGPLAEQSTALFEQLLAWLRAQFEALAKGGDSQELAVHLLSALQGVAVLAHSLSDPEIVVMETKRLQRWIRTLGTKSAREA
jgi:TetR/AcrR family transcriptional regulator, transcriptional repressor for nem operon